MMSPYAILYQELAACDPFDVCERAFCEYEEEKYRITIWNEEYLIDPHARTVDYLGQQEPPHAYLNIFILNYLLKSQRLSSSCEWVSEKDFPGGVTFFRGPHLLPTEQVSLCVGDDLKKFTRICASQGGKRLDLADSSYSFQILANVSFAVLYWVGDEDFPAEVSLLFDKKISAFLALDTIYALAVEICHRLSRDS